MRSLLRFRHVLVLAVLLVLVAAAAPADAQTLLRTLDTPNPQAGAAFGNSVAVGDVNGDGKADIVVGAPQERVAGNDAQGRVYIFSGATGALLFTLDTPNPQAWAIFGYPAVVWDVNGDGKANIAVGAGWEDVGGNTKVGRAYVFSLASSPPQRAVSPTAAPTSEPTPTPAATGRAEVSPNLNLPSTGSGGESGASARGSGWAVACYALLASGAALVAGGWYAGRGRLR